MDVGEVVAIALAGLAAGAINTVVGSGTLITFPVLLAFGYSPVTANVSNTIGLVPGSVSGAVGYRRELAGQGRRMLRLGTASLLGGTTGAVLLLILPASAFKAIVPVFIAIALALVVLQPRLNAMLVERQINRDNEGGLWTPIGVYAAGVYGGYFGAAQGIILMGILGALSSEPIQRLNGYKNVLATIVNGVAAVVFILVAPDLIDWLVVLLIAIGSTIGGVIGSTVGRRLSPPVLRGVIVVIGLVAVVKLLAFP
jgi:uncharacterized protein